jgi:Na+/melibiose symporter-like transporter
MKRNIILAIGLVLTFCSIAAILTVVMPGPHKATDYLVIGAIATFVCLLLFFFLMMKTMQRPEDLKRKKPE